MLLLQFHACICQHIDLPPKRTCLHMKHVESRIIRSLLHGWRVSEVYRYTNIIQHTSTVHVSHLPGSVYIYKLINCINSCLHLLGSGISSRCCFIVLILSTSRTGMDSSAAAFLILSPTWSHASVQTGNVSAACSLLSRTR